MPVPQELSFPVGLADSRAGLLTRVQDVTAAKFNASSRPRRRCKSDRARCIRSSSDLRFEIGDRGLGIGDWGLKKPGFLRLMRAVTKVSGKKTRFLTTRA